MTSSKKRSKLIRNLTLFIIFLVGACVLIYLVTKTRDHFLMQKVKTSMQTEFDKIQLPNQVSEDTYAPASECEYDYKVGATRCYVKDTKYFVSNDDPIDEFMQVDTYIINSGWQYNAGRPSFTVEEYQRMRESGFMPFGVYRKEQPYPIKMYVTFLGDKDRESSDQNPIELLDKYSSQYSSIYSISITADIIPR